MHVIKKKVNVKKTTSGEKTTHEGGGGGVEFVKGGADTDEKDKEKQ